MNGQLKQLMSCKKPQMILLMVQPGFKKVAINEQHNSLEFKKCSAKKFQNWQSKRPCVKDKSVLKDFFL